MAVSYDRRMDVSRRRQALLRRLVVLPVGLAAVLVGGFDDSIAARQPTYLERATIMDTFNTPGRSFSSRCLRIVVSTVNPRYATATSPLRPVKACVKAGEVGDGYVLFRRENNSSLHWRNVGEGNDPPCVLPAPVRHDLFPAAVC